LAAGPPLPAPPAAPAVPAPPVPAAPTPPAPTPPAPAAKVPVGIATVKAVLLRGLHVSFFISVSGRCRRSLQWPNVTSSRPFLFFGDITPASNSQAVARGPTRPTRYTEAWRYHRDAARLVPRHQVSSRPRLGLSTSGVGYVMAKREPQIILKTDQRQIVLELGSEGILSEVRGMGGKPGLPRRRSA
jgi:hypothetical protein